MNKHFLEAFIAKYNLSGTAEAVILVAEKGKGIRTKFISDDKNVIGYVRLDNVELEEGEYPIYNTSQLKSLLSVLSDADIDIKVLHEDKSDKTKPTGLLMSDTNTKVTFVLADKSSIPSVPNPTKTAQVFDASITIDQKFLTTFIKASSALSSNDTFAIVTNKAKTLDVVLGYSTVNTNRVTITPESDITTALPAPLEFSSSYFKSILLANKEMEKGIMHINSKGVVQVIFIIGNFSVEYYLVKIDTN